jgi:hypothetical protein
VLTRFRVDTHALLYRTRPVGFPEIDPIEGDWMPRTITIIVVNATGVTQSFFFYAGPAQYNVSGGIYTQSLKSATVAPSTLGSNFAFQIPFDYYAAVQSSDTQSKSSAIQQISLSNTLSKAKTSTAMSTDPIALTPPVFDGNVPAGAFRIVVPIYDSNFENYYVGTGLKSQSGLVILTSYIRADPNTYVDVTPTTTFYVAVGNYGAGRQIDRSQVSSHGECDASARSVFSVTYNHNGTFDVQSYTGLPF